MSNSGVKTCPECAEEIKLEARVCRYCGTAFSVVRVGYCLRCHKVTAASDMGVCAICGSRLIDLRLESEEISGPTIGIKDEKPVSDEDAAPVPTPKPEPAPKPKPEPKAEPESDATPAVPPRAPSAPPASERPPAPLPPPGPPSGITWVKPTPPAPTEPAKPVESVEPTVPAEPAPPPPPSPSDEVAERLAAFGRRDPASPATTKATPATAVPTAPPPARSETKSEPVKEKIVAEVPSTPAAGAGERMGIVPSLAQRVAYPFYLLAVIAVIAVWLIDLVWDSSLKGTTSPGSQTLADFVVATFDNGTIVLLDWQIGLITVVCALLIPTRLLPKGWFRQRGVAKDFAKKLEAKFGVNMLFAQKLYFHKLMLALALWAIALGLFVARLVREGSFVLEAGGYVALGGLLVGFGCSAVLAVRRTPVVVVDARGKIRD